MIAGAQQVSGEDKSVGVLWVGQEGGGGMVSSVTGKLSQRKPAHNGYCVPPFVMEKGVWHDSGLGTAGMKQAKGAARQGPQLQEPKTVDMSS